MTPEKAKLICRTARTIDDGTKIELLQVADLIESLTAEHNKLRTMYEAEVQWRKAYQEGKGNLYYMGGAIAEAAMKHLPCNEAGVDQFFRKTYVYREDFDALTAERDTLAAQVVQMREALEEQYAAIDEGFLTGSSINAWECNECGEFGDKCRHLNHTDECNQGKILKVLALTPIAAEAQVKEWREKAELLDYVAGLRSEWAGWRSPNGTWSFVPNVDYGDDFTYSASSLDDSLRAARKEASDARK